MSADPQTQTGNEGSRAGLPAGWKDTGRGAGRRRGEGRLGRDAWAERGRYLQGRVQVPAGLVEGLLGRVSGVAHPFQRVDVLQAASLLLPLLSPDLGQFLGGQQTLPERGAEVL